MALSLSAAARTSADCHPGRGEGDQGRGFVDGFEDLPAADAVEAFAGDAADRGQFAEHPLLTDGEQFADRVVQADPAGDEGVGIGYLDLAQGSRGARR